MPDDFSLDSNEAKKLYARFVIAQAAELAQVGALDILSVDEREGVQAEAKALLPYLRKQMLFQLEDVHPSLSAEVLAEIDRIEAQRPGKG